MSGAFINIYCERTDGAFWSEPLNALSNIAFMIAALAAVRVLRRMTLRGSDAAVLWVMVGLAFAIGVGSFLFHTFAQRWAAVADVVPILLFTLVGLAAAARWLLGWPRWAVGWGLFAYLGLSTALTVWIPRGLLNGSEAYLATWLVLAALPLAVRATRREAAGPLAGLAALFTVALFFRTIDQAVCDHIPIGTHFLWHLLNGIVIYGLIAVLAENRAKSGEMRHVAST